MVAGSSVEAPMVRIVLAVCWIATSTASAQLIHYAPVGNGPISNFGFDVDCAGDVDADGFADFIVGSPFDSTLGSQNGRATVLSGADGSIMRSFYGTSTGQQFGYSVAGVGDVNSDNHPDLLVGTLNGTGLPGFARVFSGANGSPLYSLPGTEPHDQFGSSVSGLGDVDGDGVPDFVIGASQEQNKGSATVFSGATGQVMYKRFGGTFDRFGDAVSGCGDVDGDGFADVIVGAPQPFHPTGKGYVSVFSGAGGTLLYSIHGPMIGARLGTEVHGGVDLDLDGHSDFVASAPYLLTTWGEVTVFSGATGGPLFVFSGGADYDHLGLRVRIVPDLNGDGYGDVVMSARVPFGDGEVRVRSGMDGSLLRVIDLSAPGDGFGSSLCHLPDINGDRFPEIVVGQYRHDLPNATDAGRAVVMSIAGVRPYGMDPTQEMTLIWDAGTTSGVGDLQVAFGAAIAPAFLIVGSGQFTTLVGSQIVLVDLVGQWFPVPIALDPLGSWSMEVDLTQASMNGTMLFLQAAQVLPSLFIVSNGIQMLFSR
jgi:hypothetical protein